MERTLFDDTHELFREAFRAFVAKEIVPYADEWERAGIVDKTLLRKAGEGGFIGVDVPGEYGGGGVDDFRYNVVMAEEIARAGVVGPAGGLNVQNDSILPYLVRETTREQKEQWLPAITAGDALTAVAMSEPSGGSDLAAMQTRADRDGEDYIVNGAKTFISNGISADLVVLACKTDPSAAHRGISLLVVDTTSDGFERGRNLDKIGLHSQDTAELFFNDVRVPVRNRLGEEGSGFRQLVSNLPRERLSLAVTAVAMAETAFGQTLDYARSRHAFGRSIGSFQHNRFQLAEMRTEIDIAQVFVDRLVETYNAGALTAEAAAKGKWWCTELLWRVLDQCLQLHGGYGYMEEYPIARAWRDGRVLRIVGGTNQIMKDLIGRNLGL